MDRMTRITIYLMSIILLECFFSTAWILSHGRMDRLYGQLMRGRRTNMAMDDFVLAKLESIRRTYDTLNERLTDPDVGNDRKLLLSLSKERSSLEDTVAAFNQWKALEEERQSLEDMDKSSQTEVEMKEIIKEELRTLTEKQTTLEEDITVMLLPKDPYDERNVMLEIRAASGGDEAGIFAGDLMNIYRKYCEREGWKVSVISSTVGDAGGFKSATLQITGDHVYSKLKYEVSYFRAMLFNVD